MPVRHSLAALAAGLLFSLSSLQAVAVTEPLDIDASSTTTAQTDGLLVLRYLFGLRGTDLVEGALGNGATRSTGQIENYLGGLTSGGSPALDIDGNGTADALTDGLLVFRYLTGLRGQPLIQGVIGSSASRASSTLVENYLATLTASLPPKPAGCSIGAAPTSAQGAPLAANTSVQLTASCTGGSQPITYTWDSGAFVGAVRNVAPGATTTYSVVASNEFGAAAAVTSTVYIAAGAQNFCTGNAEIRVVDWPASGQVRPTTNGFDNQIIAFRIEIPFTFNPPLDITHAGQVAIAEVAGQPVVAREFTVSKNSCDFTTGSYLVSHIGTGETATTFTFYVNNPNGTQANTNFQSGDVIYVNVRNAVNGAPSCGGFVSCDILFDFATPNRY